MSKGLTEKESKIMRASQILRINLIANGHECPECGERGAHNDNGERGAHRSYCCSACGEQWDASFWFAKLPEDAHAVAWG